MSTAAGATTADEIFADPPKGRFELVRGEVRMQAPAGGQHGWLVGVLTVKLGGYVLANNLGQIFGAETGFVIETDPDTVRAPDVAFISADRFPGPAPVGFMRTLPDLVVEVISPGDRATDVSSKTDQWLRAGVTTVWLIDPQREAAEICQLEKDTVVTRRVTELTHAELLPGFALPVASLFE